MRKTLCIIWGILLLGMFSQPYLLDEDTLASGVYGPVAFAVALALIGAVLLHSGAGRRDPRVVAKVTPIKTRKPTLVKHRRAS